MNKKIIGLIAVIVLLVAGFIYFKGHELYSNRNLAADAPIANCPEAQVFDNPTVDSAEIVTTIPVETTLTQEGTPLAHEAWLEMINNSKETLDFGEFYLSNKEGERLEPIIQAIIDAATKRNVKVRILTDRVMVKVSQPTIDRLKEIPNVEILIFNWKELTGGILHAKYFIVDNKEVYVGSQNFDYLALKHIHETGLHIKSESFARSLAYIFELDWRYNKGETNIYECAKTNKPFKFMDSLYMVSGPSAYIPQGVKFSIDEMIKLINDAKKKVTVQLLHYSLHKSGTEELFRGIDNALRDAAGRGVQVKMLISDWSKKKPNVDHLKDLSKVKNIEIKFATIPEASQGFIPYSRVIHSKIMRVDDNVSWIGTSNWEHSYFYGSRNIEIVSTLPPIATTLDTLFEALWTSKYAYLIDPATEYTEPVTH